MWSIWTWNIQRMDQNLTKNFQLQNCVNLKKQLCFGETVQNSAKKLLFIQYRIFLISLSVWDNSYLENAKVIVICMLFKRTLLDAKIKMAISRIFINSNKFCNNSISKSVVVFSNSASFHTSRFRSLEKEPHIIKSRFEDVPLSKQPFSEFLWSNSEKFSQRTSLVRTWRVCKKK